MKIGQGYDVHRLRRGRKLVLGGVEIPFDKGEDGHSDGDVLIHALIDALLGAACLGDIGTHFPPSDERYKNISSRELLRTVRELLAGEGYEIVNIDSTVVLEEPKIRPFIENIRKTIASDLTLPVSSVSVKGKTGEGLGAVGSGEAIEAVAICLLQIR